MSETAAILLLIGVVAAAVVLLVVVRRSRTLAPAPSTVSLLRLTVAGEERRAYLVRARNEGRTAPSSGVILGFHGGSGSPERFISRTGLTAAALRSDMQMAFPEALGRWADGRKTVEDAWSSDAEFMRWLIELFETDPDVDARNLFTLGVSNGAMFALRLGCEFGDRLRGIAAVCGAIPEDYADRAPPGPPVPLLLVNATEDRFIPWHGGQIPSMHGLTAGGRVLSVDETIAFWRERNRCDRAPLRRSAAIGPHRAEISEYHAGAGGADLWTIRLVGAGHGWPRPTARGQTKLSDVVLDFFLRQRAAEFAPEKRTA